MSKNNAIVGGVLAVVILIALSVGATAYYMEHDGLKNEAPKSTAKKSTQSDQSYRVANAAPAPAPVAQKPACNDGNIVGTVIGGAAGGVAGSTIGKGSGKTAATIGGTLGGAVLGNQYIPTQNVTCR